MFLCRIARYKTKNNWKSFLLVILVSFFCSSIFITSGIFSNYFYRQSISYRITNYSKSSNTGNCYIGFEINDNNGYSGFQDLFEQVRELNEINYNRVGYGFDLVFDDSSPDFSKWQSYTVAEKELQELTGSQNLTICPSPYNWVSNNKHEIWNLNMLFNENNFSIGQDASNFCSIPISWATSLLNKDGLDINDYRALLGQTITITYKNIKSSTVQNLKWTISNIFLEDEVFEKMYSAYGWFIPCYTSLPSFEDPSVVIDFGVSTFSNEITLQNMIKTIGITNATPYMNVSNLSEPVHFDGLDFKKELLNFNNVGLKDNYYLLLLSLLSLCIVITWSIFLLKKGKYNYVILSFSQILGIAMSVVLTKFSIFSNQLVLPISIYFIFITAILSIIINALLSHCRKKTLICKELKIDVFKL